MSGPDYAWWHGIYDVSNHFYTHFIPEVKQVAGEPLATQLLDKYVYSQPGHKWVKERHDQGATASRSRNSTASGTARRNRAVGRLSA